MKRVRYALAAKHRSDTFGSRGREDNFMGVFKNIRHSAAVTVCVVAMSIGLATAAQASTAGPSATGRPASLALSGGLRAVRVPGSRTAVNSPDLPPLWTYKGTWVFENVLDAYAITIQTSNSDGKLANHLYMWDYYGNTTQQWYAYEYYSLDDYLFVSAYNGLCINVSGVSGKSGTQLIVYSCAAQAGGPGGEPKNEVFNSYAGKNFDGVAGTVFLPSYDSDLAIGIGNNFPGNGAWVIVYTTNYSNYEENWASFLL